MNKLEMYETTIENAILFGEENALLRLKVETAHFDFVFERDEETNDFVLVQTKAVIRALGKVTKVVLNDTDTYEAAYERTRQHWSDYFKRYREQTPEQRERAKTQARLRAKRYRQNKRAEEDAFLRRG